MELRGSLCNRPADTVEGEPADPPVRANASSNTWPGPSPDADEDEFVPPQQHPGESEGTSAKASFRRRRAGGDGDVEPRAQEAAPSKDQAFALDKTVEAGALALFALASKHESS